MDSENVNIVANQNTQLLSIIQNNKDHKVLYLQSFMKEYVYFYITH